MNTLTLNRPAHTDTLQFSGEIKLPLALMKLDAVGRLMVDAASKPAASKGDQLRALAELYDAWEARLQPEVRELTGSDADKAWEAATRPGDL